MKKIILILSLFVCLYNCNKKEKKEIITNKKQKTESKKHLQSELKLVDTITAKKTDTVEIVIGKINDCELVYNRFGNPWDSENQIKIKIYYKKNNVKKLLLNPQLIYGDFIVKDVSIFKYKNDNFLYIGTQHSYGHFQGYLYYLNTLQMKTYEIESKYQTNRNTEKITDTLEYHESINLEKDDKNKLTSESFYRSKKHNISATVSSEFKIIKLAKNKFILKVKNEKIEIEQ